MKPLTLLLTLTLSLIAVAPLQARQLVVYTQEAAKTDVNTQAWDTMLARAESEGAIRVLVGLNVDVQYAGKKNEVLPRIDPDPAIASMQADVETALASLDLGPITRFRYIPYLALSATPEGLAQLAAHPGVRVIEEDVAVPVHLAESTALISADATSNPTFDGSGQAVAIIDTGVDKAHSFFQSRVVSEACYSTTSAGTSTSVCPGGVSESTASGSGVPCDSSVDGCDHGTHVAGIAAADATSFDGVARGASIIALQVFSRFDNASNCGSLPTPCALSFTGDQVKALERVLELHNDAGFTTPIAVVNMSLGGSTKITSEASCDAFNGSRKTAIDNLRAVGIATVISSGNNSFTDGLSAPACISSAISVGSVNDGSGGTTADDVSSFSNTASFLDLMAPGAIVESSVPGASGSTDTGTKSGTSMAAPHVAGAIAVYKHKNTGATVDQALTALQATGVLITDTRPSGDDIVTPRIKVDDALNHNGLPVELVAFEALQDGHMVQLTWTTASEKNNAGFDIQQRMTQTPVVSVGHKGSPRDIPITWKTVGFKEGQGTTSQAHTYRHTLSTTVPGRYRFRLKQVDFDGSFSYSAFVEVVVDVPETLALSANYPNPFNPTTHIDFHVPTPGQATLTVFDVLGREVAVLFDGAAAPDRQYQVTFDGGGLLSGVYLYTLQFGGQQQTGRMLMLK